MEKNTFKFKNGKFILKESYNSIEEAEQSPQVQQNPETVVAVLKSYNLDDEEIDEVIKQIIIWGMSLGDDTKIIFNNQKIKAGLDLTPSPAQQTNADQSSQQHTDTNNLPALPPPSVAGAIIRSGEGSKEIQASVEQNLSDSEFNDLFEPLIEEYGEGEVKKLIAIYYKENNFNSQHFLKNLRNRKFVEAIIQWLNARAKELPGRIRKALPEKPLAQPRDISLGNPHPGERGDTQRGRTNRGGLTESIQNKSTIRHPSLVGWRAR